MYTLQPPPPPPLTGRDVNAIRHPRERPAYWFAVIINALAIVVVLSWIVGEFAAFYRQLDGVAQERGIAVEQLTAADISEQFEEYWYNPKNQSSLELYLTIGILFFFTVLVLQYYYAVVRTRSVQVTPGQFGTLYAMAEQYAHRLGLRKMPEIYLVQENGVLNAFASNIIRKKYIQINADLFEIAVREHGDYASIGFVLAHEMAHIRLRHVSIWVRYTVMLAQLLPIIGPTLSRAREYSCDRLAQVVSGNNGIEAMMALTTGKHLYKNTNVADYLEQSQRVRGFWVWVVNLASSHPILPKRVRALADPSRPGKLF